MINEPFLSLACAGLIGILFGLVLCFAGYRLFIVLLPIWAFVFGFALGAQAIQVLFNVGFLATVTSWVVGLVVGAIFAALSYLFYIAAVAIIAGSLGYSLAVGILMAIGLDMGILVWIIGIVVALIVAVATIVLNLQKWVIIAATAILGSAAMIETVVFLFNPVARFLENPVRVTLEAYPLLAVVFVVLAILGIIVQWRSTRTFMVAEYSRWDDVAV